MRLFQKVSDSTPSERLHRALTVDKSLKSVDKVFVGLGERETLELLNHRYPDGSLPIHLALKTKVKIFQRLVDFGADPRAFLHRDHLALDQSTPALCLSVRNGTLVPTLCVACETGNVDMVAACLRAKCPVNSRITPGDMSALHISASMGDLASVNELLRAGADPKARTLSGKMPVDVTTDYNVKKLLQDHMSFAASANNAHSSPVRQAISRNTQNNSRNSSGGARGSSLVAREIQNAGPGAATRTQQQRQQLPPQAAGDADILSATENNVLAQLKAMGYDDADARYCIVQMKLDKRAVSDASITDLIDSLANLDLLRGEMNREIDAENSRIEQQQQQQQEQQQQEGGKYEYFIHTLSDQHYVTYLTDSGERYYILERPGDRQWAPFPDEWLGVGMFVECDDDPGKIDPFQFDGEAGGAGAGGAGGEHGDGGAGAGYVQQQAHPTEKYQIFTRSDNGAVYMTCLLDGRDRYYARPETDEWVVFPPEWENQGRFRDLGPREEAGADADAAESEAAGGVAAGAAGGGGAVVSAAGAAGGGDDEEEPILIKPKYAICVLPDGTRQVTCMVDGTLYLASGDDWSVFPNELLTQVRFEAVPEEQDQQGAAAASGSGVSAGVQRSRTQSDEDRCLARRIEEMLGPNSHLRNAGDTI